MATMAKVNGTASDQVGERIRPSRSVGAGGFKIYSEKPKVKIDIGSMPKSKGATSNNNRNPRGGSKVMEKSNSKFKACEVTKVERKVLADVSNVVASSARNLVASGTQRTKGKSEGSAILPRASSGLFKRAASISSTKSIVGKERKNLSQGSKEMSTLVDKKSTSNSKKHEHTATLNRTSLPAVKRMNQAENSDQKEKETKNLSQDSTLGNPKITSKTKNHVKSTTVNSTSNTFLIPTRISLPNFKRMSQLDKSDQKENVSGLKEAKKTGQGPGALVNKASRKVITQNSSSRIHRLKNRPSNEFVSMPHRGSNVDGRPSLRKSIKPVRTTQLRNSVPLKSSSSLKKSVTVATIPLKKNDTVTFSVPEVVASVAANKNSKLSTDSSDAISKRKSVRRKSFTSILMSGSKFLEREDEAAKFENLPSIDDERNQLEVAEYVDDIYEYHWVAEAYNAPLSNYMSIQAEVTSRMRGILINWLIEVHHKFDLMPETLYLSISLLDRYLSEVPIKKSEMQLIGLTALLLASKYEDFWHPRIRDLISISAEPYTREQILGMEKLILRKLKFRLNVPTSYVFMIRFLKAAQSNKKLEHLAFYLIELCLVAYEALTFKTSLVCASAIYVARSTLRITPAWTPLLEKHTHYGVAQMRECVEMILRVQKKARTGQLKVTFEKYMDSELSSVADIKPLDRL